MFVKTVTREALTLLEFPSNVQPLQILPSTDREGGRMHYPLLSLIFYFIFFVGWLVHIFAPGQTQFLEEVIKEQRRLSRRSASLEVAALLCVAKMNQLPQIADSFEQDGGFLVSNSLCIRKARHRRKRTVVVLKLYMKDE